MQLTKGTTIKQFLGSFSEEAQEELRNLSDEVGRNEQELNLKEVGRVTTYIDECSEGADRGGYVPWITLHDHTMPNGKPVELEWIWEDGWYFSGRLGRVF